MRDVSKRLRGGDFRHAVEAVAALRHLDAASGARLVPTIETEDPQRAFQLLIARRVVDGGVHALAAQWRDLSSPHWREMLFGEIGQSFHLMPVFVIRDGVALPAGIPPPRSWSRRRSRRCVPLDDR